MTKSVDLVAIGRSSVDLYGQQIGGRLEDMASFAKYIGGSPTNTAIGLARLGLKSVELVKSERVTDLKEFAAWCRQADAAPFPGPGGIETARLTLRGTGTPLAVDRSGPQAWPVLATVPLGTGRVFPRLALANGQVEQRDALYLSLSFDHRALDGAPAARFLSRVRDLLELPVGLL